MFCPNNVGSLPEFMSTNCPNWGGSCPPCPPVPYAYDPRVIAGYYIEAVDQLVGCPSMVRGDMGTENGHVAGMQRFLTGQQSSFLYGKSTHNQRIESFWSILRKECSQFWMDTLRGLIDEGLFTGDFQFFVTTCRRFSGRP